MQSPLAGEWFRRGEAGAARDLPPGKTFYQAEAAPGRRWKDRDTGRPAFVERPGQQTKLACRRTEIRVGEQNDFRLVASGLRKAGD